LAAPKDQGFKKFIMCLAAPNATGGSKAAESKAAEMASKAAESKAAEMAEASSPGGGATGSKSSGQRHDHTDSPGQAPAPSSVAAGGWVVWRCVGQFEHDDGVELKAKFDATYTVGATIGEGTFGKVFGAVRRSDNAAVAVKALTFAWLMLHTRCRFETQPDTVIAFKLSYIE
jgi:hypothetical protein